MSRVQAVIMALCAGLVFGCGGGGGGGGGGGHQLIAKASAEPFSGLPGTIFTLDASQSTDSDNQPLTYQWTQLEGQTVQLDPSAGSSVASFQSGLKYVGDYLFSVAVSDGTTVSGDTVRVNVHNSPPVAKAIAWPSSGWPNNHFRLDASQSTDSDNQPLTYQPLTYQWTQLEGATVELTPSADSVVANFQCGSTYVGDYLFSVAVSDGTTVSGDTVRVNVYIPDPGSFFQIAVGGLDYQLSVFPPTANPGSTVDYPGLDAERHINDLDLAASLNSGNTALTVTVTKSSGNPAKRIWGIVVETENIEVLNPDAINRNDQPIFVFGPYAAIPEDVSRKIRVNITDLPASLKLDFIEVKDRFGYSSNEGLPSSLKRLIWTMSLSGSGKYQLINSTADRLFQPTMAWSPGMEWITFDQIDYGATYDRRIYIIHPDGSHQRPISPSGEYSNQPSFSPTGKSIVYECMARAPASSWDICLADLSGASERDIIRGDGYYWDGDFLNGGTYQQFMAGGFYRTLLYNPVFSPDGQHLLFTANDAQQSMSPNASANRMELLEMGFDPVNNRAISAPRILGSLINGTTITDSTGFIGLGECNPSYGPDNSSIFCFLKKFSKTLILAEYLATGKTTGTFTKKDTLDGEADCECEVLVQIGGANNLVLNITGKDSHGGAISGKCTVLKGSIIGTKVAVTPSTARFTEITGITNSNGNNGDKVQVQIKPWSMSFYGLARIRIEELLAAGATAYFGSYINPIYDIRSFQSSSGASYINHQNYSPDLSALIFTAQINDWQTKFYRLNLDSSYMPVPAPPANPAVFFAFDDQTIKYSPRFPPPLFPGLYQE